MPRSQSGKKRKPVQEQDLTAAAEAVIKGTLSYHKACKAYKVKIGTLHRHVQKYKKSGKEKFTYEAHNDVHKVFSTDEEILLVEYLTHSARLHYGLPKKEVRKFAYQYAKAKGKKYPSMWDTNNMAGEEWLRIFMKTYSSQISLRKPEATSLARSIAFNKSNVGMFFTNLVTLIERHKYPAHRIYNCDETGMSTVHNPPKVVAPKGVKQIGSMTSGERGINITVIGAINAVGNHVPPMMIFPRVNFKTHMINGAPPGTIGGANPSGWSNQELFLKYLDHFILHTNASTDNPVLLILDNHESHVNLPVIDRAREAGVSMITFPPHTSHKLQPLDRTVFGPLKTNYNRVVGEWMIINPGRPLSIYDVAEMFGKAYPKAFTTSNITSGFAVTGIYPLNSDVFSQDEFLSSYVTDLPNPNLKENIISTNGTNTATMSIAREHNQAGSSNATSPPVESKRVITPEMVRPYPKATARKTKAGGRAKGKTRILTDTPEKEELEKKKEKRSKDSIDKPKNIKSSRRQLIMDLDESESESLVDEPLELIETEFVRNNLMEEMDIYDEEEERFKEDKCDVGDFILVKLATKKSCIHYVAEIYGCDDYGDFEIKYLKRLGESDKFIYEKDETFSIPEEDIVMKLTKPSVIAVSERQLCHLTFDIDLNNDNFKVQ